MNNPVIFQKLLTEQWLSTAQILSALSHLSHLVYLKNVNQPVIAFFASEYMLKQGQVTKNFQRISLHQYQKKSQSIHFNNFFEKMIQNHSSYFNGGLIGVVGYDHAAQQQVPINQKNQPTLFLGIYRSYLKPTPQGWTFFSDEDEAESIFQ